MKIFVLQCSTNLRGSHQHFTSGAWKNKPSPDEIKHYIKTVFPGCYDEISDELLGEFFVCELTLYSNMKTHLRKT